MKRLLRLAVPVVAMLGIATSVQAMPITYIAALDGASEFPPHASPGAGEALGELDLSAHLLRVMFNFSDLVGNTIAADDVAISLATGGGGNYADNAVGFLGDYVVYRTTSSNATPSDGSGNVRYGDYFDVRNATGPVTEAGQGVGYATHGYAVTQVSAGKTCAVGGCNVALQYVLFGRNSELFPEPSPPIR